MFSIKKTIIALFIAAGFAMGNIKAQQVQLGISPEINFPTGNASSTSGIGFGGSLKLEVGIAEKYALTANGGYAIFLGKRLFGNRIQPIEAVPAKLGFKYYPSADFYFEAQGGAAFQLGNNSKTSFLWSPGFGTYIKTGNANAKIDFGLRYEAWTNSGYRATTSLKTTSFSFIGLKVGYTFGF
jgi:hypothetical protein